MSSMLGTFSRRAFLRSSVAAHIAVAVRWVDLAGGRCELEPL